MHGLPYGSSEALGTALGMVGAVSLRRREERRRGQMGRKKQGAAERRAENRKGHKASDRRARALCSFGEEKGVATVCFRGAADGKERGED